MNKTFKVNYLARDFASIKKELKNYASRYYSDQFSDLSEASINSLMIDAASYVGDVLSYYIDYQANESFLATAIESKNILALAKSLGYKKQNSSTTVGKVALFMLIPATSNNEPDYARAPIIKKGTELATSDGARKFLLNEDIIIDENLIGTNYVVARSNTAGSPTYYAIKLYVPVVSGVIKTTIIPVGNFVRFNSVPIDDFSITEIISVTDSDGNEYYEVPNLTQNIVYRSVLNRDSTDSNVRYMLKTISAQRRFVVEYDTNTTYLKFGGKQYKPDDDLNIDPIAEPSKFILDTYNNDYLKDGYFEPNKLLNGDDTGTGPDNTTLTIKYRVSSAINNSALAGELNTISSLQYSFNNLLVIPQTTIDTIIGSIQVVNEESITNGGGGITDDELKDLAGYIFQSQNRAVTAKDYETLAYMLPAKYGSIKRVKAERDTFSIKNNINLYVVGVDALGNLAKTNTKLKENLKYWLIDYKMLTDSVDILDAKIINFGIDYKILVDPNYDKIEVKNLVDAQLAFVYSKKSYIGQAFNKLDVYREIRKIKGVLDIIDLRPKVINGTNYSNIYFSIDENLTSDGNMIILPRNAIYEIKNPSIDITGTVI
jgi:hypothetical protein